MRSWFVLRGNASKKRPRECLSDCQTAQIYDFFLSCSSSTPEFSHFRKSLFSCVFQCTTRKKNESLALVGSLAHPKTIPTKEHGQDSTALTSESNRLHGRDAESIACQHELHKKSGKCPCRKSVHVRTSRLLETHQTAAQQSIKDGSAEPSEMFFQELAASRPCVVEITSPALIGRALRAGLAQSLCGLEQCF